MGMNFDRHVTAHRELFHNLIKGDGDSADKHREFYDEFLAVMDLSAEYYLQTIETVFLEHKLPKGTMVHRNRLVDPGKIQRVALMTVEGEKDDISGIGQTFAAQILCTNLADAKAGAPSSARRRPLWRVQRLSIPGRNRAENQQFHSQKPAPERDLGESLRPHCLKQRRALPQKPVLLYRPPNSRGRRR